MPKDLMNSDSTYSQLENQKRILLDELSRANREDAIHVMEKLALFGEHFSKIVRLGNSTKQRQFGIYYTSFSLARALVDEAIRLKGNGQGTFFEPCVGGGAFLFAFLEASLPSANPSKVEVEEVLNRCYVADNDPLAVEHLQEFLPAFTRARYGHSVTLPTKNIFLGDSLFQEKDSQFGFRDFELTFGLGEKFDFIVTNPPYLLLKSDARLGNKSVASTSSLAKKIEDSKLSRFSEGTKNLYKIFTEAILDKWLVDDGVAGLLIPRSLLTDNQSKKLRAYLLSNFRVGTIVNLNEGNEHFKSVGQAFSAFAALKGLTTNEVVFGSLEDTPPAFREKSRAKVNDLKSLVPNGALFELKKIELSKLVTLSKFSTISETHNLVNLRGEFDMTFDKKFITDENTGLRLIQGSDLGLYSTSEGSKFVSREFLNRPKGKWVTQHRIACQQISNMNSGRRLKWSLISPGQVLGNSCNFIAINFDKLGEEPYENLNFLLGILNSELMNWRFKLLSSNNHVSNAEIASFPLGGPKIETVTTISSLVGKLSEPPTVKELALIDEEVNRYFLT